ncbi:MAG: hypothetical protein MUC49_13390 [Raineya sp.]|jgi:hypothetical protein|nr:hypothetical protein [Raineya sp.]
MNKKGITKFGFEFLTIFIGVFSAFALDNWNNNRKDNNTELKILSEINNGLKQDIKDINGNMEGHKSGLLAANFFGELILNKRTNNDSLAYHYLNLLRTFISVQNVSGYETLKSKGLEIVKNNSLRTEILSLYENDYNTMRKLEENYSELQFFAHYRQNFDNVIAPNFIIDENGKLSGINTPLKLTEKERNILLLDLWRITYNRNFVLMNYMDVKNKIMKLQKNIEAELNR